MSLSTVLLLWQLVDRHRLDLVLDTNFVNSVAMGGRKELVLPEAPGSLEHSLSRRSLRTPKSSGSQEVSGLGTSNLCDAQGPRVVGWFEALGIGAVEPLSVYAACA